MSRARWFTTPTTARKPCVVVVDGRGLVLVDLLDGQASPVTAREVLRIARKQRRAPRTRDWHRACAAMRQPTPITDPAVAVVEGPQALLVEAGRILAWDQEQQALVALDPAHLELLERCATPTLLTEITLPRGEFSGALVTEMAALGLLRVQHSEDGLDRDDAGVPRSASNRKCEGAAADIVLADSRTVGARPPEIRRSRGRIEVIPLYAWPEIESEIRVQNVEPCLSLGALLAHARHVDRGRLNDMYTFFKLAPDLHRHLEGWRQEPRPAIFLFSDYIWNLDAHLALTRLIKALSPESLCVHGGPSCPKYNEDAVRFFDENPGIDVAVRGEGEDTFVEILEVLRGRLDGPAVDRLAEVEGITFRRRGPGVGIVRTADRPRPDDLDRYPSPYLTGEFDDLLEVPWWSAAVETNRGCPYGCTFCDWGSATLSRVRCYDLDRVCDELTWIMEYAAPDTLLFTDANFGILARDVEITRHLVKLKEDYPDFRMVIFSGLAKNTTKHTSKVFSLLAGAGIVTMAAPLAVQSVDETTLQVNRRQNIRLERYDELAEQFIEMGLPVMTDLMMGLPGSTVASFRQDLQHCFDRDVSARIFQVHLLPNSPMNEPDFRRRHSITTNDRGVVVGTSSYTAEQYEHMVALRRMYRGADHFGVLRHLLRFVQWDHRVQALDVLDAIHLATAKEPQRYPLLAFFSRAFDLYTIPPVAWELFFAEVRDLLGTRFAIPDDSALRCVSDLQIGLAPRRGRQFPDVVSLAHDYPAYVQARRAADRAGSTPQPLASFGPTELAVDDPTGICETRLRRADLPEDRQMESKNAYWVGMDWELASVVARRHFSNQARLETAVAP